MFRKIIDKGITYCFQDFLNYLLGCCLGEGSDIKINPVRHFDLYCLFICLLLRRNYPFHRYNFEQQYESKIPMRKQCNEFYYTQNMKNDSTHMMSNADSSKYEVGHLINKIAYIRKIMDKDYIEYCLGP